MIVLISVTWRVFVLLIAQVTVMTSILLQAFLQILESCLFLQSESWSAIQVDDFRRKLQRRWKYETKAFTLMRLIYFNKAINHNVTTFFSEQCGNYHSSNLLTLHGRFVNVATLTITFALDIRKIFETHLHWTWSCNTGWKLDFRLFASTHRTSISDKALYIANVGRAPWSSRVSSSPPCCGYMRKSMTVYSPGKSLRQHHDLAFSIVVHAEHTRLH